MKLSDCKPGDRVSVWMTDDANNISQTQHTKYKIPATLVCKYTDKLNPKNDGWLLAWDRNDNFCPSYANFVDRAIIASDYQYAPSYDPRNYVRQLWVCDSECEPITTTLKTTNSIKQEIACKGKWCGKMNDVGEKNCWNCVQPL